MQADINGLLVGALRKAAAHDRVVFVDINVPPSETPLLEADWFNKIASQFERLAKINKARHFRRRSSFSRTSHITSSRTTPRYRAPQFSSRASTFRNSMGPQRIRTRFKPSSRRSWSCTPRSYGTPPYRTI